jgi:hypothetical protein
VCHAVVDGDGIDSDVVLSVDDRCRGLGAVGPREVAYDECCQRSGEERLLACFVTPVGQVVEIEQALELTLERVTHVPDLRPQSETDHGC